MRYTWTLFPHETLREIRVRLSVQAQKTNSRELYFSFFTPIRGVGIRAVFCSAGMDAAPNHIATLHALTDSSPRPTSTFHGSDMKETKLPVHLLLSRGWFRMRRQEPMHNPLMLPPAG